MRGNEMKRNEEKINEWRLLFEERKERGLTVKEFCKGKNLTPSQYYYYQEIINKPKESQKQTPTVKEKAVNLKPIQLINNASKENNSIRFILPNSLQCVLPREMTAYEMKVILELMMSC